MKRMILIAVCLLLIGGCVSGGGSSPNTAGTTPEKDPKGPETTPAGTPEPIQATLKNCSVSTGGGMLGGYRHVTFSIDRNGEATLEIAEKETHADREVRTVYRADPKAAEELAALAEAHDLRKASKQPYSDLVAYDAETTSVSFTFSDGYFSISENQILDENMTEGFDAVIRYLNALATGEGVRTLEPQCAYLYLRSGYTLQFLVEDAFDGKLDDILSVEREVFPFGEDGIVLCAGEQPDLSGAEPVDSAEGGTIVYDGESGQIVLLYADHTFDGGAWILARIDGYAQYACPLIAEMEGPYRLYLNGTP